ncbi:unnamed protein product, partial [Ixodes hexagonus]
MQCHLCEAISVSRLMTALSLSCAGDATDYSLASAASEHTATTATAVQDANSPPHADSNGQLPHCSWQDPQAPALLDARLDAPKMLLAAAAHVDCAVSDYGMGCAAPSHTATAVQDAN